MREGIGLLVGYALRVPLHGEQPGLVFFVFPFCAFYDAIGGVAISHQLITEVFDSLMMGAIDDTRVAAYFMEQCTRLCSDRVLFVFFSAFVYLIGSIAYVLYQVASESYIDQLVATTDSKDRMLKVQRGLKDMHLKLIACGIELLWRMRIAQLLIVIKLRVHIHTTGQQYPITVLYLIPILVLGRELDNGDAIIIALDPFRVVLVAGFGDGDADGDLFQARIF